MSLRTDLISEITTNISAYTSFSVSPELPLDASGIPLYEKNKRVIYVSDADVTQTQLYRTLDQGGVYQTDSTLYVYMTQDAKNTQSQTSAVITAILNAKSVVTNPQVAESTVDQEIQDDIITYSFEFNFITI